MIAPEHALGVERQAELIGISRGTAYYVSRTTTSAADEALMKELNRLHLDYPFAGARILRDMLNRAGHAVGRKHVGELMRKMDIEAMYRKPNTSKKHPEHAVYPYLLRKLKIEWANQVWAMGHHLHSNGAGLGLPGCRRRLGEPTRARTSGLHHHGHVLSRGARRGSHQVRQARDLQYDQGSQFTSAETCRH